jgi:hypothetical protein
MMNDEHYNPPECHNRSLVKYQNVPIPPACLRSVDAALSYNILFIIFNNDIYLLLLLLLLLLYNNMI